MNEINFVSLLELRYQQTEGRIIEIVKDLIKNKNHSGLLLVLLKEHSDVVPEMVQLKPSTNPIAKYVNIDTPEGISLIEYYSKFDGAIVISACGQILSAGVYLVVNNPSVSIPEGCGTRHKAAASFSFSLNVRLVFTISEENNLGRIWDAGKSTII